MNCKYQECYSCICKQTLYLLRRLRLHRSAQLQPTEERQHNHHEARNSQNDVLHLLLTLSPLTHHKRARDTQILGLLQNGKRAHRRRHATLQSQLLSTLTA